MMSSYSASKRRNINKMLDYDNIEGGKIFERNFQDKKLHVDQNIASSYIGTHRRQYSNIKNNPRPVEEDKQNYNFIQSRLDKYDSHPIQGSIKKSCISPIKNNYNYEQLSTSRRFASKINQKQINFQDNHEDSIANYNYSSHHMYPKENTYNYNSSRYESYKRSLPMSHKPTVHHKRRNSFNYDQEMQKNLVQNIQQPFSARFHQQSDFTATFLSRNNSSLNTNGNNQNIYPISTCNANTTPKKGQIQSELLQKSQFLKQRMERINRMTPKGSHLKQEKTEQLQEVTPQKAERRQFYTIFNRQPSNINNAIVKHNKYCDEKLPLQTIYDAEQRLKSREQTEEGEDGIQQINLLSKKISQKLKQIINRHSLN